MLAITAGRIYPADFRTQPFSRISSFYFERFFCAAIFELSLNEKRRIRLIKSTDMTITNVLIQRISFQKSSTLPEKLTKENTLFAHSPDGNYSICTSAHFRLSGPGVLILAFTIYPLSNVQPCDPVVHGYIDTRQFVL